MTPAPNGLTTTVSPRKDRDASTFAVVGDRCLSSDLIGRYQDLLRDPRLDWVEHHRLLRRLGQGGQIKYAREEFGAENMRHDAYGPKTETNDFLVLTEDGLVESSLKVSDVIARIPPIEIGLIFVPPELSKQAKQQIEVRLRWLLAGDAA